MSAHLLRQIERLLSEEQGGRPDLSGLDDADLVARLQAAASGDLVPRRGGAPGPSSPYAHLSDDEVLRRLRALRKQLGYEGTITRPLWRYGEPFPPSFRRQVG